MALNAVSGTWVHRSELEDSCNWVTFVHRRRLLVVLHNDVSISSISMFFILVITFFICFRIVTDNVDFTVHARHQTKASQNKSLHWTHAFAVKNRVNPDSTLNYDKPQMQVTELEMRNILPSETDQKEVCCDLVLLVYRKIVEFMPCYAPFKSGVQHHILHSHTKEMSKKSDQVMLEL